MDRSSQLFPVQDSLTINCCFTVPPMISISQDTQRSIFVKLFRIYAYSRTSLTRTPKGNVIQFELAGVQIAGLVLNFKCPVNY